MTSRKRARTRPCPNCGEPVSSRALACPECGSDAETGWSDDTYLDGLELPDDDAYEEFLERELGVTRSGKGERNAGWRRVAWVVILALLLPLIVGLWFLLRR